MHWRMLLCIEIQPAAPARKNLILLSGSTTRWAISLSDQRTREMAYPLHAIPCTAMEGRATPPKEVADSFAVIHSQNDDAPEVGTLQ